MISVFKAGRLAAMAVAAATVAALAQPAAAAPFRMIITEASTPLVPNSVMELAEQLGYFDREGLDVQFIRVSDTTAAAAALIAGEGEMANISVSAALALASQDQLAFKAVTVPDKYLPYVIAARSSVATLRDLAGKPFGVANVGSLDYTLSVRVLDAGGVPASAVSFVAVGAPPQRGTALIADQIAATTMSIGTYLGLPDKTGLHILVGVDEYKAAASILNKVNIVPDTVLAERRAEVVGYVRALTMIARDFDADPSKWVAAMVTARPDYARENLEILGPQFKGSFSVNGGMDRATIEAGAEAAYAGQELAGLPKIDLAKWVDFSITDEVLAGLGGPLAGTDPAGR